jgi:signal transduction histidine kinase
VNLPSQAGAHALIGVHFWPEWGTSNVIAYDLFRTLAFVGALGISFTVAIVWFVLRRVHRATRAADRWAAGDFSARIIDRSSDEFSALAERFNRMADALAHTIKVDKALAVSVERNRIARDLHDTAKQRSFVLGLKLTELEHDARAHGELLTTIADARRLVDHLQQDLVRAVSGFNLPAVTESGLRDALTRSIGDLLSGSHIEWSLEFPHDAERTLVPAPVIAQELMAITHEAVANARRHSGCTSIRVTAQSQGRLTWIIADNGKGFDPALATDGMGLTNLHWRARSLPGGALSVDSSSAGTRVVVSFDPPGENPHEHIDPDCR